MSNEERTDRCRVSEPSEELFIDYDYSDPRSKGITNERPIDVLVNKGQLSSEHVIYSEISASEIGHVIYGSTDSDTSDEMSSDEDENENENEDEDEDVEYTANVV